MIKDLLRVLLVGGVVVSSLACAAKRPVLYPNAQLQAVGAAAAQQDIDDCLQKAAAAGYTSNARGQGRGVHRGGSCSRGRSGRGRRARLPAGPERARPWARPGAAREALSGGSSVPGTWTRCSGGLWTNASKRKATRSSAGNKGQGGLGSTPLAVPRLNARSVWFRARHAVPPGWQGK